MRKSWLKTVIAAVLIVLILSGLILVASGSAPVYLLAVNDSVMEMTAENMPLFFNNQLYIPYTMLSSQVTGINLGVRAQYSSSRGTLTITDSQRVITFNIIKNTAFDEVGNPVNAAALVRDTMVYIPIDWLCRSFSRLMYSLTYTSHGILVRLCNDAAVLTDAEFIDAADSLLRQNRQKYQSAQSQETLTPSISPSPSPSPTSPVVPPEPVAIAEVCMAFRWGDQISDVAKLLEENGQRALFLFTYKELMQQDDLVRRLIAKGHQVGLSLVGDTVSHCLNELEYGLELMKIIGYSPLLIVSPEKLPEEDWPILRENGAAIWSADIYAADTTWETLSRRLNTNELNHVEFVCNINGLIFLKELLYRMDNEQYLLVQVLAPML